MSSPVLGSKNSPGGGSNAQHGMSGQDAYGVPGGRMHNFKNSCSSKEANLMPVPSPQQIQFPLLDGQELTIQKQPNTSLRDSDLVSPSVGGDPSTPNPSESKGPGTPAPHTPGSQMGDAPPKYPGGPQVPGAGLSWPGAAPRRDVSLTHGHGGRDLREHASQPSHSFQSVKQHQHVQQGV